MLSDQELGDMSHDLQHAIGDVHMLQAIVRGGIRELNRTPGEALDNIEERLYTVLDRVGQEVKHRRGNHDPDAGK